MPKIGRTFMPGLHRAMRSQMESGDFPVPVLWLKFGENTGDEAKDSSPEGNDGDIEGASWTTGHLGPGLSLDGLDDYVSVPYSASLDGFTALTISFWMYPTDYGYPDYYRHIMNKGWQTDGAILVYLDKATQGRLFFYLRNDDSLVKSCYNDGITALNKWYHVVAVWDGSTMNLYVDLVAGTSNAITGAFTLNSDILVSNGSNDYKGVIDELRIYDEALSARQKREIYYGLR